MNNSNGVARIGSLPCFTKCISTCSITTKYPSYLPIPRLFYDMYSNDLQRDVTLKASKSRRWAIKLGAVKGGLFAFRGIGWVKFVQENGVKVGDKIMFTMLSGSLFAVKFLNSDEQQQQQLVLLPVKQEVVDSGDGGNVEDESPPRFDEEVPQQQEEQEQEEQQHQEEQAEQEQDIPQQQQNNLKRRRDETGDDDYDDNEADSGRSPPQLRNMNSLLQQQISNLNTGNNTSLLRQQMLQQQQQGIIQDGDISTPLRPCKKLANGSTVLSSPPPLGSPGNPVVVDLWKSENNDVNSLHLLFKTGPNEDDKQFRITISTSEIKQQITNNNNTITNNNTSTTSLDHELDLASREQDLIAAAAAAEETALAAATAVVPVETNDNLSDEEDAISGGNLDGDAISGKPQMISVGIKTSNLAPYCKFPIPKDFAKQWLPGHSTNVIVVDSTGAKHAMSWIVGGKRMLGKGWSNFVKQHNLQIGYRCELEVLEQKLLKIVVYDNYGRLVTPVA